MANPTPTATASGPPASYYAHETSRDGRPYIIRALRPGDRDGLLAAIGRTSPSSLYRRFFSVKRYFSEREADYFLNIDFAQHVALVAEVEESGKPAIVAGARYVLLEPGRAEIAFAVIDDYQGQGVGSALMRSLLQIARSQGLRELVAEVLPENAPMLSVFEKCGLNCTTRREPDVVHVTLAIED